MEALKLLLHGRISRGFDGAGPQVILGGPGDYTFWGGTYGSRCIQMVDRAAALTQTRVMFVPTLYWVDDGFLDRKSVNSQVRHLPAG